MIWGGILFFNRNNEKNSQPGRKINFSKFEDGGVLYKKISVIKNIKNYLIF